MAATLLEIFGLADYKSLCTFVLRPLYVNNDKEVARREAMRERIELYEDKGTEYLQRELDAVFRSIKIRNELKKFAHLALSNNLAKRIINESSVVYIEPARREVKNEQGNERYQELIRTLKLDQRMRTANRFAQLCNNILLWPYCFTRGEETRIALEIVTPEVFWVIADPLYPLEPVGFIIDQWPTFNAKPEHAHYLVITKAEVFKLNKAGDFIEGTIEENPYERLPILVSRNQSCRGILDSTSGQDIIAGHLAAGVQQVYLLRDQKSGTKAPYVVGESAARVSGQHLDREVMMFFPTGTTVGQFELGSDPDNIIKAQDAILQHTGAAYGLPIDILNHNYQATSGYEIDLKRISLREKRREQIVYCRDAERELAEYLSVLTKQHLPDLAFDTEGWNIDFAEYETPLSPDAEHSLFIERRNALLTNTVEQQRKLNPDLTEDQAIERLEDNAAVESVRLDLQVERNQGLSTTINDNPQTPAQNGASGVQPLPEASKKSGG